MAEHKLVDGIQIPLSAEEIAQRETEAATWAAGAFNRTLASLRARRNALLSATDYLALSDNTLSTPMLTYRQNLSGSLTLFNPSSATYVKHFISTTNISHSGDYTENCFLAGYFNTTSAINAIQFKMSSGNIDEGTILMYGIV